MLRPAQIPIDLDRLWQRHEALAQIGGLCGGGVDRQAFSHTDAQARALIIKWARARAFHVFGDKIGNIFIRRGAVEADRFVLTGSHIDTQINDGRFDGVFGVLAGLEVLEALEDAGIQTRLPIEVVIWSNEEGTRFSPGCMGSMCFAGSYEPEDFFSIQDADGITLKDALAAVSAATPALIPRPVNPLPEAFIEAHVEQGPVLQRADKTIGIVSGIQGVRWFEVHVSGQGGHAGTMPMSVRQDALREGLAMIAALQAALHDPMDSIRLTVGKVESFPNAVNSIPEKFLFTVDLRHHEPAVLKMLGDQVAAICRKHAERCQVEVKETLSAPPCKFDPWIVTLIGQQVADLGYNAMSLPSGAFHDAMYIARVAPTGMIFVPSRNGVTKSPVEFVSPQDLEAGCMVLLKTLMVLAR